LFAQEGRGLPVLLLPRHLVERQEVAAEQDVINVVVFELVGADRAVLVHEVVNALLDELEVPAVARRVPDALDALEQDAEFVSPLRGQAGLLLRRVAPEAVHGRRGHALRKRRRGLRRDPAGHDAQ
jgi:hypothetical protein